MLNQIIIVGRLVNAPTIVEEEGKKLTKITIAVQRTYKNENGEFETDFIDCVLYGPLGDKTANFCSKGDLLAIKGSIRTNITENDAKKEMYVVAEKISFLSSIKQDENNGE